jgi:hypothetical protein
MSLQNYGNSPEDFGLPSYVMDRLDVGAPPATTFGPEAPAAPPAVSNADINSFVQANIGNPQAIADAAQQYGVSPEQLSQATGYDMGTVNNYFSNAGINMWGQPAAQAPAQPVAQDQTLPMPMYQAAPPTPPTPDTGIAGVLPPSAATRTPEQIQQDIISQERQRQSEEYYWQMVNKNRAASEGTTPQAPAAGASMSGGIASLAPQATTPAPVTPPPPAPPAYLPPSPPKETQYGTVTPYTTSQIKDYVSGVLNDTSLTPWERTNKIMEQAQTAGISQNDLNAIYGKEAVNPYMTSYGAGIKDYITKTLSDTTRSDFDKAADIHNAAAKYGLDPTEVAKYSGLNQAGVNTLMGAYDQGLANIAKSWDSSIKSAGDDPAARAAAEANRAKTALALQSQYNVSDADLAKATGTTVKTVQDYLTPVKEAPKTLQGLLGDASMTSDQIKAKIDELRKNPAVSGIYGAALDKFAESAAKTYSGDYNRKQYDSLNPLAVDNVLAQLKAQQQAGTAQYYQGGASAGNKGGFGSLDKVTEDMAKNLVAAGITDIKQVGQRTVTTKDEDGNDITRTEVINKVTGEPLSKASNYGERTSDKSWSGTYKGPGNTGYDVQFDKSGNPVFYTHGESSSDMGQIAPLLAMASFIPGAAPFVSAINAAYAASQGNLKGALLSGLGAAGPLAGMAGASADTVANIGTASKLANVANAISNKDVLGTILSGVNATSDKNLMGDNAFNPASKVVGDFSTKDLLGGFSAANALANKDYTTLANVAAQMSGSKDAITATKGLSLVKALQSNNPMAIAQAVQKMNTTQDVIGKAGGGLASLPGLIKNGNKNTLTDKSAFDGLNGSLVAKMLNQQPPAIRAAMLKKMMQTV